MYAVSMLASWTLSVLPDWTPRWGRCTPWIRHVSCQDIDRILAISARNQLCSQTSKIILIAPLNRSAGVTAVGAQNVDLRKDSLARGDIISAEKITGGGAISFGY